ncbi:putative leucine-rich repeat-containing protein DDB_G0290503 [Galendromus occidentalis]|uniref:Leucine-rich repeat-containing protein DDB_G0290503 n=1 Tax=Galendromus occidentalis TaxID=34638 RepID=A0AAJ7PAM2_9ACAR|nr:putative leucine-rich repeat-containing protein DDB_G0290503 [Galendromus occidentalis]
MGANGSTPRLKRKNSPGDVSDSGSRKSRSSDGSFKTPPTLLKESGNESTKDPPNERGKTKDRVGKPDRSAKDNMKDEKSMIKSNPKQDAKKTFPSRERRNMFGRKQTSAPMANIDSDSEEGAPPNPESADEIEFHTPPPIRKAINTYKEIKQINKGLTVLNDVNRDTKEFKMYNDSKDFNAPTVLQNEKTLSLDNNLTRLARDKISMLEATKTEQEIVINKLQTEVVKLKEKVRHLCKLRQDLLEQRSQVEDRMRSVQREREHEINQRDSKIRELEDELEQYECKMEYLEHTQVHLQRSLLASENKTPKLLEELQKISQDLAECRDELKEKNHRIHELASSVMTKEAMIERLQADLKAFKKEAAAEMEKRFLTYTEEKERLMSQLQEETEEYVKAAFAEKDCQLKELNEEWQNRYDQLNDEILTKLN